MTATTTDLVFFYGTLMSGQSRDSMHSRYGVEFVGPGKLRGDMFSINDGFPGLVTGEGEIVGEVWRLPADPRQRAEAVALYDSIEGYNPARHDGMYLREIHELLDDEEGRSVSVYRWNRGLDRWMKPITSGSWAEYAKTLRRGWYGEVEEDTGEFDGDDELEGFAA